MNDTFIISKGLMKRYLLTSESSIKKSAVVKTLVKSSQLDCKKIPSSEIPDNVEQPVGIGGLICCKNRILAALKSGDGDKYTAIISIENGIDFNNAGYWDEVHAMIYDCKTGIYYYDHGSPIYFLGVYVFIFINHRLSINKLIDIMVKQKNVVNDKHL